MTHYTLLLQCKCTLNFFHICFFFLVYPVFIFELKREGEVINKILKSNLKSCGQVIAPGNCKQIQCLKGFKILAVKTDPAGVRWSLNDVVSYVICISYSALISSENFATVFSRTASTQSSSLLPPTEPQHVLFNIAPENHTRSVAPQMRRECALEPHRMPLVPFLFVFAPASQTAWVRHWVMTKSWRNGPTLMN